MASGFTVRGRGVYCHQPPRPVTMALARLGSQGRDIPNGLLTHISPAHSKNVNYLGIITVEIEAEMAKLDNHGHRPPTRLTHIRWILGHCYWKASA